jgi:hypothetical protein
MGMNRIYQGKVTAVEIPNGTDDQGNPKWKKLDDWPSALWQHHVLFQDAVNYYTLALAAMADGVKSDSPKGKAISEWRAEVLKSWLKARRKAMVFDGPHKRLAVWLDADPTEADTDKAFTACAKALLKKSPATPEALAKALVQLLEEADQSDLNQFCVSRLPWLCTAQGKLDATPKNVAQQQEGRMLTSILKVHGASTSQFAAVAEGLELGWFVAQMPRKTLSGAEARAEAERLFISASTKSKGLVAIADKYSKRLDHLGDQLKLPYLGRKPKGAYPLAAIFKLFPTPETWEAFKATTESFCKKAEKLKNFPLEIGTDFIAEARTAADQPIFDYFTNLVLIRESDRENRAVWFDFDLAAFIEAVKSPHRYFQDALSREAAAAKLREKLHAIDPDASWIEGADTERNGKKKKSEESSGNMEDEMPSFTFAGDTRIALLRKLVTETLASLPASDNPEAEKAEYTIRERTLRGWTNIREEWRKLVEKGQTTSDELWKVVKAEKGQHSDDFGSAVLYEKLTETQFQPIWREKGAQPNHAEDPLQSWRQYKELQFELEDKERPIRFTPAHAVHSPRRFIIPKAGKFGSEHEAGTLAFTAGVVLKAAEAMKPLLVRVHYAAPRLRRDGLRTNVGENLESTNWLQPMMKPLGLAEHDTQDFSQCRIILQPSDEQNIQLIFPLEITSDKLVAGIGKRKLWARQFNLHPNGGTFNNATLRWPHEKPPAKPPKPWFELVESFSCVSVKLGQRDAGAYAVLLASADAQKDFGKRPSRFIGETGEGLEKKSWRAALIASGMLRLPGEDCLEWRAPSKLEQDEIGFGWREELFGERGRTATPEETAQCARLLADFGIREGALLPENWRTALSFPEQNDNLLRAASRAQWRVSRLHRWCWFLTDKKKAGDALKEIRASLVAPTQLHERWLPDTLKTFTEKDHDPRLTNELASLLRDSLGKLPELLESLANRILPLHGRSWKWEKHPNATIQNRVYWLTQNGKALPNVRVRGQRGLSLDRIEQIEELRRRFQSLNQTLRRDIAGGPPIRRDEAVPESCPDLLEKLDQIKEQRINQTAHMILAEALGVKLTKPPADKSDLRYERDQHGVYAKLREPVDFIVIEDLSSYRASQGRAPRENSRLMKLCHRGIRNKLIQLCELFGIPVLETPAAWSSRFCSRSGVAGFHAVEVHPGLKTESPWSWYIKRLELHREDPKKYPLSDDARAESEQIGKLFADLDKGNKDVHRERPKWRTLYAPKANGPIFIPICEQIAKPDHEKLQPAIVQSDINAAINLALRAIADPRLWSIYPRLRTQRENDGSLIAREKRKYGEKVIKRIEPPKEDNEVSATNRNPCFFADLSYSIPCGHAQLEGDEQFPLVSGKALWSEIKKLQWKRIHEINQRRQQPK